MKNVLYLLSVILLFSCARYENIDDISGDWELYKNNFIITDQVSNIPYEVIELPGGLYESVHKNNYKWGSIRKKIKVKKHYSQSLLLNGIYSASKIWIDGKLYKEYGRIGKSITDTTPYITPDIINFTPENDYIDLVIEFSNFHLRENLVFKWIKIGSRSEILNLYIKNQAKDYFSAGILVIISIFFILIFVSNIKSRYNLYFALFTLSYGIRSFFMEKTSIHLIVPSFPWELIYQLTKASELWSLAAILLFFRQLYPMELKTKTNNILVIVALCLSGFSFLPLNLFSGMKFMYFSHVTIFIAGNYLILKVIKSIVKGRTLSRLSFLSITLFSIATFSDILSNRYVVSWGYYSAQIVIVLVITMCILVSKERYLTIVSVKEQERHNALLRKTFSRFVPLEILKIIGNDALDDRLPGDSAVKPQTIAYIDIRDYTKLSQGLSPEQNFKMINDFFKIVGSYVSSNNGFIESYGGDGVKIIFSEDPKNAINMAVGISEEVNRTSGIKIGISIHFGQVVMGTIGSENRIQATALSGVTRELTAMDHFNSKMGIEILLTSNVLTLTDIHYDKILHLGNIKLKGEETSKDYYQLIPPNFKLEKNFKEAFENGVLHIKYKNFPKAFGYFTLANRINPNHLLTKFYLKRLDQYFKLKEHSFTLCL